MNATALSILFALFLIVPAASALAFEESNESPAVLQEAETQVQAKLDAFGKTDGIERLAEARKLAFSLNPRQRTGSLSSLDEGSLRLQIKVLLAIQKARDPHYDPAAPENIVYLNVAPPVTPTNEGVMAGMAPSAIKDPVARKAYEEAIAANHRRNEKSHRELDLSRGVDYCVISIWRFTRGLAEDSAARRNAFEIIEKSVPHEALRKRLLSDESPGLTR